MDKFDVLTCLYILSENYNLNDKPLNIIQLIILKEFEKNVSLTEIKKNYELFKKRN